MKNQTIKALWVAVAACAIGTASLAQVKVTKNISDVSTLDLSGFRSPADGAGRLFRQTVESDLNRSGWFSLLVSGRAEYSVVGDIAADRAGVAVKTEAYHVLSRERLLGKSYTAGADDIRKLAHKVADDIIFALTGKQGMSGTRIVLIGKRTGNKEVYVCDADGANLWQVTNDKSVSLAPKWGPDCATLVYTSYRAQFPDVLLINLATRKRSILSDMPGLNTGGALSPDGRETALTLSKDGQPNLYVKEIASGRLTRLTTTKRGADAAPCWSPDGKQIVFVSDRSGSPQLYIIGRNGGEPRRITSRGSQNVDPDWGPNGFIAYCSLVGKQFQIFVLNPSTLDISQVSKGDAEYEDPSWAPDGRHLVCARTQSYRSRIFIIDTLTGTSISLLPETEQGDWVSPDWSKK